MNASELAGLIQNRGHNVRVRGNEVVFHACLYCSNPNWNLEASATKYVYHCWACGASGRVADLLEGLGLDAPGDMEVRWDADEMSPWAVPAPPDTVPLDTQPSALAYLRSRGVSEAEARWLGVSVQRKGPRLVFPVHEFWYGYGVGYVKRGYGPYTGPKYMNDVNVPDSLPGWLHRSAPSVLCVVEGVFDALAVRRAGYSVAMLLGTGRTQEAIRWVAQATPACSVVVLLDSGAGAQEAKLCNDLASVHPNVSSVQLEDGDPAETPEDELRNYIQRSTS